MGAELIALWLAEGAVTYIGGLVLSSIVGSNNLNDIAGLINAAVAEIKIFTRQAIDQNEIRKLTALLESVHRNLLDYSRLKSEADQKTNSFLLTDAILKTSDAVSQSASLGIPAIFCYANSVSLNLIARSAYYKLTENESSDLLIKGMIDEAKAWIESVLPPFLASWEPANRIKWNATPCVGYIDDQGNCIAECYIYIDNYRQQIFDGIGDQEFGISEGYWNEILQPYLADAQNAYEAANSGVVIPMRKIVKKWEEAIQSRPNSLLRLINR